MGQICNYHVNRFSTGGIKSPDDGLQINTILITWLNGVFTILANFPRGFYLPNGACVDKSEEWYVFNIKSMLHMIKWFESELFHTYTNDST